MSQYKYAEVADLVYFWFAANETTGTAGDGASPLFDVRLAGGAAGDAPTASGTPTLLTHANYSPGLYEIAVDTTGYAAGEYAVFCTLTISTVNPAGFVGSVKVRTAGASALNTHTVSIANDAITAAAIANGAIDAATFAADVGSTALATNMIAKAAEKALGVAGLSLTAIPTVAAVTTVTNLTNNLAKYMHGAVWIDSVNGAAGTASYTNGIVTNPVTGLVDAKSIADNLKLKRFWLQSGTSVTMAAAFVGYCFDGRGYVLALGGQDVSKAQIDRCEGLSGTGLCTTGEVVVYDSHLNAITIGEADFVRCHLNNTVTMSQATVPYRFHDCTGITGAKITFGANNQTAVISNVSGVLTIAGMTAARASVCYLDGDGDVTLDATNTGGNIFISGNIRLTHANPGVAIVKTSMFEGNTILTDILADVAATHTHAAAADTQTTATAIRADVGLATANLDTQLAAANNGTPPAASAIADAVWDEALSGHTGAGSAGLALATASSGGVDPSVLADAIWDEALSGHSTAGTTGKKLTDLVNADLTDLHTDVGTVLTNLATVDGIVDNIHDTDLPAVKSDTGTTLGRVVGTIAAGTHTAQTGDSFARLGSSGAGLTALGDTRLANLDATVSSRTKPADTQAAVTTVGSVTGAVGSVASYGTLVADVATAVWAATVEGTVTTLKAMRAILAGAMGDVTPGATTTITDTTKTKTRITATTDTAGTRTVTGSDLT